VSTRKSSSERTSDPPDLHAERETFVRNFLHKGVELTEDLIRENRGLESQLRHYQEENVRLRAQLASDDAIRELLSTIETLQQERTGLLNSSRKHRKCMRSDTSRSSKSSMTWRACMWPAFS
jgi:hypothetical protein